MRSSTRACSPGGAGRRPRPIERVDGRRTVPSRWGTSAPRRGDGSGGADDGRAPPEDRARPSSRGGSLLPGGPWIRGALGRRRTGRGCRGMDSPTGLSSIPVFGHAVFGRMSPRTARAPSWLGRSVHRAVRPDRSTFRVRAGTVEMVLRCGPGVDLAQPERRAASIPRARHRSRPTEKQRAIPVG